MVSQNKQFLTMDQLSLPMNLKSDMKQCGIHHIHISPYHSSSNGLAEHAVQTFKSSLKKLEGNVKTRLFTFLARYWVTPHSKTELSPAELLMGRKL